MHAEVHDIVVTDSADSAGTIGSSSAEVHWPVTGIQQTLAADPMLGMVTGVKADKAAGTLRFEVGSLAEMTVRPYVSGGRVTVDTIDARVLIIGR